MLRDVRIHIRVLGFSHTLVFSLRNRGRTRGFKVSDLVWLCTRSRSLPLPIFATLAHLPRAIRFNLKSFNQCVQAALNQNVRPSPVSRVRQTFPPPSPLSPPPPPLCIGTLLLCYVSPISCTPHPLSTL